MRIGILTFHRAHNYGAVLQCYALQQILKDMGHDAEIIDYRQPYIECVYKPFSLKRILFFKRKPRELLNYLRRIRNRRSKTLIFDEFKYNFLSLSSQQGLEIPQDYDAYVIGSDQLWGRNCLGGKLDPVYFGQFVHRQDTQIVGYAISSNLPSLTATDNKELKRLLSNFTSLSVRENTIADYIYNTVHIHLSVTLDPTLLTTPELWEQMINREWSKCRYILVYYVSRKKIGWLAYKKMLKMAHQLAEKYNCEVVDLSPARYRVEDFVSAFKYAQCVITSSFHATVFSIIFNRPLYSLKLNDGFDVRYANLLESLGMTDNLVDTEFEMNEIPSIDYIAVNKKLSELKQPSFAFLTKSLNGK